jgi:6-phosphogluconolactonase
LRVHVAATAEEAAAQAAEWLRAEIARAATARGRCLLALSGAPVPRRMLRELRRLRVHWQVLQVFQVDERAVPATDERRSARQLGDLLIAPAGLAAAQFHPMPVERRDLATGAAEYARLLAQHCGTPPVLDVVQLSLGADGHTAALLPGDPLLADTSADVGVSGAGQGERHMTLTLRCLNAARHRLWLVAGAGQAAALGELWSGSTSIAAGRVAREAAFVFADATAAAELPPELRRPHGAREH